MEVQIWLGSAAAGISMSVQTYLEAEKAAYMATIQGVPFPVRSAGAYTGQLRSLTRVQQALQLALWLISVEVCIKVEP